jgi:hypothetical protein
VEEIKVKEVKQIREKIDLCEKCIESGIPLIFHKVPGMLNKNHILLDTFRPELRIYDICLWLIYKS